MKIKTLLTLLIFSLLFLTACNKEEPKIYSESELLNITNQVRTDCFNEKQKIIDGVFVYGQDPSITFNVDDFTLTDGSLSITTKPGETSFNLDYIQEFSWQLGNKKYTFKKQ